MPLLQINNLNITYNTNNKSVMAVRNFNLTLNNQESIGIVGESGSGKSTLAMAILRLLPLGTEVNGQILLENNNLLTMSSEEFNKIRWSNISLVFQKSMNSLSPVHKIGAQMIDICKLQNFDKTKNEIKNDIFDLFKLVNLPNNTFNSYPHELSGGMLQRVNIAISLLFYPKLLIFDEATTALDVVTQGQILDEIIELEKKLKLSRIMITHDLSVVASSCKKIAVMYAGELLEVGYVNDVLNTPLHPYTLQLLNSYPNLKTKKTKLEGIPGSLPDLSIIQNGCIFAPRCKYANSICFNQKPKIINFENERCVACHYTRGESYE